MKRFGLVVGVSLLAVFVGLFSSDPAFWLRYASVQLHRGETLQGNGGGIDRPRVKLGGDASPLPASTLDADGPSRLQSLFHENRGRALVVLQDGALAFEAYADENARTESFDGAALARLLPVLLTGALLADGTLPGYEATIGTWLEDFSTEPRSAIILAHLLTMSSGLEVPRAKPAPFSSGTQFTLGTDIAAALAALPVEQTPGIARRENPADSQLLVQLLERARGEDFASLFARRLWAPLGGGEASFALDRRGGTALGHCCFRASAVDWARLAQLFVDRGRVGALAIVPAQFLEDMAKPSLDPRFGMGVRRLGATVADLPPDAIAIEGGEGQFLIAVPSRSLALAWFAETADEKALIAFLQTLLAALPANGR